MLCRLWLVSCLAAARENFPAPGAVGSPAIRLSSYPHFRTALHIVLLLLAFPLAHAQTPTLVSIAVTPTNPSIASGTTQQFTATGTYSDNSSRDLTATATWTSTAPGVITINAAGFASAVAAGTATITATSSAISGSTNVTVGPGSVNYVYDDLGRLLGVIAPDGSAAIYNYDAVGNILSVTRKAATQISIIQFTPASGPVGTTVTIQGTGFSTTVSQNTVQFNGTAATVNSATTNQLAVIVPNGATTGPVSVTSPYGTATGSSFTVTQSTGAPTIVSFAPQIAGPGTPVVITGTNFNLSPNLNRVRVNITPQPITSVSATQLSTTVASSTTPGHIFLSTPQGRTVSQQDFFVPFNNHTANSVGFTGRFNFGGSQTVALNAGQIGMLLFDAHAGQKISLQISGSTFPLSNLWLFAPNGTAVLTTNFGTGGRVLDQISLPFDGTYTIGIDSDSNTGSVNLALNDESDVLGMVTIDGPPVTVTTTVAGQDARVYFTTKTTNQRVVLYVSNVSNPSAMLYLMKPDGTTQDGLGINNYQPGQVFFLDAETLAAAGTYQLWVQHASTNSGSETLQLASVPPDVTGTLTIPAAGSTGPGTTVTTTQAGQNASLTFSGTAGQKLSFNITNSSIGSNSNACYLRIYDPSHNIIAAANCGTGANPYLDTITLAATATYTVFIDPQITATGSVTVSINNVADVSGTIAIDGPPVTATTTVAGQDARLSFTTSTANQRVVLYARNVSTLNATVHLVKPDGTDQDVLYINAYQPGQVFYLDTETLAAAGTYQLWVQHNTTNIGSETLQLASVPADFTGSIAIGGAAVQVPTTGSLAAGQNAYLTFSGTAGQAVTVQASNNTISPVYVTLFDPSNNFVTAYYYGGSSFSLHSSSLPSTGTYTIKIDPQGSGAGSMTVTVTSP